MTVQIRDRVVRSVTCAASDGPMFVKGHAMPQHWWRFHLITPEQIFDEFADSLKWAAQSEGSRIECRFDPATGFPEFLETDSMRLSDSYDRMTATDFRVLP